MSITLNVAGTRYTFPTPDGLDKTLHIGHPLNFLINTPHSANEAYLNMIYGLCKDLPHGLHVTELMGGIGMYPRILWDQMKPASWTSVEIDPSCEQYYQEPRAKFQLGDAWKPIEFPKPAFVIVDFMNGTIRTLAENMDGRRPVIENIKRQRPEWVMISDFGHYWVHLPNHHPWYIKNYNVVPNKANYPGIYAAWMRENIGYEVVAHDHGGGSAHFLMRPIAT